MDSVVISGIVVRGLQHARVLGYPTINIAYDGPLTVRPGVYAAYARVEGGTRIAGAAIVGGDFEQTESPKLEVHLLGDTTKERYGEFVEIELLDFASELVRMSDIGALKQKIENDVDLIRKML